MITYEIVKTNLDSAIENDYHEILEWTPSDIAKDLMAYSEDCQECTEEELLPHVNKWLEEWRLNHTQS